MKKGIHCFFIVWHEVVNNLVRKSPQPQGKFSCNFRQLLKNLILGLWVFVQDLVSVCSNLFYTFRSDNNKVVGPTTPMTNAESMEIWKIAWIWRKEAMQMGQQFTESCLDTLLPWKPLPVIAALALSTTRGRGGTFANKRVVLGGPLKLNSPSPGRRSKPDVLQLLTLRIGSPDHPIPKFKTKIVSKLFLLVYFLLFLKHSTNIFCLQGCLFYKSHFLEMISILSVSHQFGLQHNNKISFGKERLHGFVTVFGGQFVR